METHGFDFIITGEVIGQRPMSQRKDTMPVVARESGAFDRLLRPLCAKILPPTLPEREGWVDREKLLDFSGRGRKPQMQLAAQFGISDYAQPAGGCCFLTDGNYTRRLGDLWEHRGDKRYELDDILLLKIGRHLRPRPHFKMIVAREEGETNFLMGYRRDFTYLTATSHSGPLVLVEGELSEDDLLLAARLTARFGQGRNAERVTVELHPRGGTTRSFEVTPMHPDEIPESWYL
jgi:tRNA U34 2-thiouridine synthase MnmA/TrmU